MIGLGVIGGLVLYIFVCWMIVRWVRGRLDPGTKKILATVILSAFFLVAPIADDLIGLWSFKQVCAQDAGVRIYGKPVAVEGFLTNLPPDGWIERYGYHYIDYEPLPGKIVRKTGNKSGVIVDEPVSQSKAQYAVRYSVANRPGHVRSVKYVIATLPSGEVLATQTALSYSGGWIQRQLAHIGGGTGYSCSEPTKSLTDLVTAVLIPPGADYAAAHQEK